MERRQSLDAPSCSCLRRLTLSFLLSLVLASFPAIARPQNAAPTPPGQGSEAEADQSLARAKALYDTGHFQELIDTVPEVAGNSPQLELYRGLAFAQLQRWAEATAAFEIGLARDPRNPRLLEELAGVEYKTRRFARAKRHLRRAIRWQPRDDYANDFLATIYFQEGNLEAALKYWNRVGKPKLADLSIHGAEHLNPVVLDRAFDFSLGSVWTQDQLLATQARLDALNAFSSTRFALTEQSDSAFQLDVYASLNDVRSSPWWQWLASFARGTPYQTVYPEFYNLDRGGMNWLSYYRWDDQKHRIHSELTGPFRENPSWQYRLYFDTRDENWNLATTLLRAAPPAPAFLNLETWVGGAELRAIPSGRWSWSESIEFSDRRFRNALGFPASASEFVAAGPGVNGRFRVERSLLRIPERRFTLNGTATAEVGAFFVRPLGRYGRITGDLRSTWFPRARGDDYEMESRLRAGRTFGGIPFDDLFTLGFDRDNDLWMRGHPGLSAQGQKGSSPLGRNYVLANWDMAKNVYSWSVATIAVGPFVDTGKISDPSGELGSPKWLWDVGVQGRIRVFGNFEFVLGWGKDLRSGRNSFFSGVSP